MPPIDPYRQRIGNRLRAARGQRTQQEIATALMRAGFPVTPSAVSQWETGATMPSLSAQIAVALVLDKPWFDLFNLIDDEPTGDEAA